MKQINISFTSLYPHREEVGPDQFFQLRIVDYADRITEKPPL